MIPAKSVEMLQYNFGKGQGTLFKDLARNSS